MTQSFSPPKKKVQDSLEILEKDVKNWLINLIAILLGSMLRKRNSLFLAPQNLKICQLQWMDRRLKKNGSKISWSYY